MDVKNKISSSNTPSFFSKEMIITKKTLNENHLKFTYQKQLISDLDYSTKSGQNSLTEVLTAFVDYIYKFISFISISLFPMKFYFIINDRFSFVS